MQQNDVPAKAATKTAVKLVTNRKAATQLEEMPTQQSKPATQPVPVVKPEYSIQVERGHLAISVELPGVIGPNDITVDVSLTELQLHCQRSGGKGKYQLEVKLPQTVQPESSKAKFSKRRQVLDIQAPTNVMRPLKHG